MTEKLIFDVALYQFMLVPVFFGVGCIFNSFIANKIDTTLSFYYLASGICIGLGLLNYFNPKNVIQWFI